MTEAAVLAAQIFDEARRFHAAIAAVSSNLVTIGRPRAYLTAITIELYLKAMATQEGAAIANGDDLLQVYKSLSDTTRAHIAKDWKKSESIQSQLSAARQAGIKGVPETLIAALEQSKDALDRLRYFYGVEQKLFALYGLEDVILATALRMQPLWKTRPVS